MFCNTYIKFLVDDVNEMYHAIFSAVNQFSIKYDKSVSIISESPCIYMNIKLYYYSLCSFKDNFYLSNLNFTKMF